MKRCMYDVVDEDAPPAKKAHIHYEKQEIGNSSFANDVTHCDITFCVPIVGACKDDGELQDIDTKTNGMWTISTVRAIRCF